MLNTFAWLDCQKVDTNCTYLSSLMVSGSPLNRTTYILYRTTYCIFLINMFTVQTTFSHKINQIRVCQKTIFGNLKVAAGTPAGPGGPSVVTLLI